MSSSSASGHAVSHRPALGSLTRVGLIGCVLGLALLLVAPGAASAKPKLEIDAVCAGDTLSGSVTVTDLPAGSVVTVTAEAKNPKWGPVGQPATFVVVAGKTTYTVKVSVPGVSGYKEFRLVADAGSGVDDESKTLKPKDCGPPTQVPEVPAPLLIPATMVLTLVVVEQFRRRRASAAVTA